MRDFLAWAAERRHCDRFDIPSPQRATGAAIDPDQRWAQLAQLLHDDRLNVVDRVARSLVASLCAVSFGVAQRPLLARLFRLLQRGR